MTSIEATINKMYAIKDVAYVTDFNAYGNATAPGRWRVYNESGTNAHAPYSGAVGGYVDVVTTGHAETSGTEIYQTLHDYYGDMYTRTWISGSQYGAWKKAT